jgi:hypothetical protein
MNREEACQILHLNESEGKNKDVIKKKYHILALRFHPDKNKSADANEHFQQINEAYHVLMETKNENTIPPYEAIIRFFTGTLDEQIQTEYLHIIFDKMLSLCEKTAIDMIEQMPYKKFMIIYKILTKYKHVFHLSPEFYNQMEKRAIYWFKQGSLKNRNPTNHDFAYNDSMEDAIGSPTSQTQSKCSSPMNESFEDYHLELTETELDASCNETMILRPLLDDVIMDNVYKCYYVDVEATQKLTQPLYIPLWHHELIYDRDANTDLTIKIIPKLPSLNYWIDDENHLHQRMEYTLCDLWDCVSEKKYLEVFFGKRRYIFYPHELQLSPYQQHTWKEQGISKINSDSIYDISKRADVILHIHITGIA